MDLHHNRLPPSLASKRLQFSKRTQLILVLLVVFSLAAVLRFFYIDHHSLWIDEGLTLIRTDGETLDQVIENLSQTAFDRFQPTYFIGLFFWRQMFGDSETAIRSFSAVLGLASIGITTLTAVRLFGYRHALWTAMLLAFSALHIFYSQDARAYTLVMTLAALQIYYFSPCLEGNKTGSVFRGHLRKHRPTLLFWFFTTIGIISSVFLFVFTLSLCASHFLVVRGRNPWLRYWYPLFLCALPGVLYYSTSEYASQVLEGLRANFNAALLPNLGYVSSGLLVGLTYIAPTDQLRGDDKLQVLLSYWPHLVLLLGVSTILILAIIKQSVQSAKAPTSVSQASHFFLYLTLTSLLFSILFAASVGMPWLPRHSSFMLMGLALLIPSAFCPPHATGLVDKAMLKRASTWAVIGLIVLNLFSIKNYYFNPNHAKDDYRSAAQYITQNFDRDTRSIMLWGSTRLLAYYGDRYTVLNWNTKGNEVLEQVQQLAEGAPKVLIVVNREFFLQYSVEDKLKPAYRLDDKVSFPYFTIYTFKTE